ncbi:MULTISPECIES: RagB/SusD family nutrient uptake outer membrane protein [Butyricimonas]|uniref:RagB/SusD family nutrient uptake outer membrane protein n=2 Tax=Butyricimonas hominis TaxID=2763032 RepID=A0ABR7D022_9BACT|nr:MULTISPECIES: RagB/SusD family nutrient uptake outer membrane protein [Butyricimonas]MBC5621271.1 RagB/SusD family nutrient uptake outer membrane protein [Butyricimonas hominis]MCB6974904.1 RagB/SusD family nutrient uptake outer membrane protein [Butyricimonas synergistica]MCG4521646.1 RagB/SusD family nutrient uptake outer membrane protein [Butyricimonas sp. DFI.6.44]
MMKKLIILGLCVASFTGCDSFIDLTPENAVTYTNAMETPEEMEAVLSNAQACFQGTFTKLKIQEKAGAYCNGAVAGFGGPASYVDAKAHLWDNEMMNTGYWGGHYATIGYANIVEYNVKSNWTEEAKNYFWGQAAFLKGMCYFDLARCWGEAPVVVNNDYEAPQVAKSSNHDLLEEATRNALRAFQYLPRYRDLKYADGTQMDNRQYGNKESAAALLAHLYAWRAAVEEGITPDKSKEYWEASEKYASMLVDANGELAGYVNLASTIENLQKNTLNSRYGEEAILELEFNTKYTQTMPGEDFYVGASAWGYPYKYGSYEGDRIDISVSCKLINDLYGENTADERKVAYFDVEHYDPEATFTWPDEPARIEVYEPFPGWVMTQVVGGLPEVAVNRAYVKKFNKEFIYTDDPNQPEKYVNMDCNKILWRYSDILLLRAEVRNFLGKTDEAIADLNRIRSRAKADAYPAANDAKGLQYAIFQERERELIYENHRFFDIMRNKGYYKTELPANFRILTEQEVKDGALYLPIDRDASEYNKLMMPNKYWYSKKF